MNIESRGPGVTEGISAETAQWVAERLHEINAKARDEWEVAAYGDVGGVNDLAGSEAKRRVFTRERSTALELLKGYTAMEQHGLGSHRSEQAKLTALIVELDKLLEKNRGMFDSFGYRFVDGKIQVPAEEFDKEIIAALGGDLKDGSPNKSSEAFRKQFFALYGNLLQAILADDQQRAQESLLELRTLCNGEGIAPSNGDSGPVSAKGPGWALSQVEHVYRSKFGNFEHT